MKKPSKKQRKAFTKYIIGSDMLCDVIEWIQENLDPEDVFYPETIRDYVQSSYKPEDIFTDQLMHWSRKGDGPITKKT